MADLTCESSDPFDQPDGSSRSGITPRGRKKKERQISVFAD